MLPKVLDYALSRFTQQLRERFCAATINAVHRGVEDGLRELQLELPTDEVLPAVRANLTEATQQPQKRGPGRPRKHT